MSQRPLFPVTALRTVVARLGIPLLLLFASPAPDQGRQRPSASELLDQFQTSTVFWKQFEVAKAIVAAKDTSVLPQLESLLTHEDRHLRGNAAFILAGLGDPRGFDVIVAILGDRSERRAVHQISSSTVFWKQLEVAKAIVAAKDTSVPPQLESLLTHEDRHLRGNAAFILAGLGDPRGFDVIVAKPSKD